MNRMASHAPQRPYERIEVGQINPCVQRFDEVVRKAIHHPDGARGLMGLAVFLERYGKERPACDAVLTSLGLCRCFRASIEPYGEGSKLLCFRHHGPDRGLIVIGNCYAEGIGRDVGRSAEELEASRQQGGTEPGALFYAVDFGTIAPVPGFNIFDVIRILKGGAS